MAKLPGLFKRNGIYYLRVVIPKSLQTADYHQARTSGAIQRATFLAEFIRTRRSKSMPEATKSMAH